jgi:hypothetical protein
VFLLCRFSFTYFVEHNVTVYSTANQSDEMANTNARPQSNVESDDGLFEAIQNTHMEFVSSESNS